MLTTIKKLFGFKVKEEEDEHAQAISTLDHAKREDHARVLEKARKEREERDNKNRERIGASSKTTNDDILINPFSPLNPINSSTFSESTSRHRKHDTSSDGGGSITPHSHGHHGGDSGGSSDGGGGDGGGGGGD